MVGYIPIATTFMSLAFAAIVFNRWQEKRRAGDRNRTHLAWWCFGILMFGAGTAAESLNTLFGWHEPIFRWWYITGALLGGAPLAQGSVYLLFQDRKRVADVLAVIAFGYVAVASIFILLAPVTPPLEADTLSGRVFEWEWVRAFSPFINLYAFIFLVGGAAYSAYRFLSVEGEDRRVLGNVLIAVGALLPGIGGSASRAGHTEVLYITEFIGLIFIYLGYRLNTSRRPAAPEVSATTEPTTDPV